MNFVAQENEVLMQQHMQQNYVAKSGLLFTFFFKKTTFMTSAGFEFESKE